MILVLRDQYKDYLLLILGYLNSNVIEYYYKHKAPYISGGYYRYWRTYLNQIPIKFPETSDEKQLAEEIVYKVKLIISKNELKEKIARFPHTYIKSYRANGIEFDTLMHTFIKPRKDV